MTTPHAVVCTLQSQRGAAHILPAEDGACRCARELEGRQGSSGRPRSFLALVLTVHACCQCCMQGGAVKPYVYWLFIPTSLVVLGSLPLVAITGRDCATCCCLTSSAVHGLTP